MAPSDPAQAGAKLLVGLGGRPKDAVLGGAVLADEPKARDWEIPKRPTSTAVAPRRRFRITILPRRALQHGVVQGRGSGP